MSLDICTVILAGGRGKRMHGEDKGLIEWRGKPLIEHILQRLPADHGQILINANRNIEHYQKYNYPVISDSIADYQGPLAGILSAMQQCSHEYLLCLPCDSPRPPENMLQRLTQCLQQNNACCALCHDGERLQPLFALLSCQLQVQLEQFLQAGERKVHAFFDALNPAICDFSDQAECFHNLNTPDDLQ
ncbi:MAG: molybdenum cofactor guanylyltransferase MobA [Gammaproteobacteria bacterium]|nr:molybdenum cofactor guanylyltransferase MobA [Gammaproteobacteria bacterium]